MLFFLLWAALPAQDDIEYKVDESLRVEYIMLDIVARDKNGNLVTDLTLDDFVVKDKRQTVRPDVFQVLDYRLGEAKDGSGKELELPVRQFILAVDTESARYDEGLKTFEELRDFVKSLPDDQPYRIKILSLERDSLKPEFVDNSESALKEIDALEERFRRFNKPYKPPTYQSGGDMLLFDTGGGRTDLSRAGSTDLSVLEEAVNHLSQLEAGFIDCKKHFSTVYRDCIMDTLRNFMLQQEMRSERVFLELQKLAYKFEDVEGLKVLLFVSAGFAYQLNTTPYELANLYLGGRGRNNALTPPGRLFLEKPFQRVVHACTKNRVVFHTFNILDTDGGFKASISRGAKDHRAFQIYKGYGFELSEGLRGLALESGGRYFENQPLVPALMEALEGERFYYVLGYPAPGGRVGKFHKIKVKVNRKGVTLSHRRGYFSSGS